MKRTIKLLSILLILSLLLPGFTFAREYKQVELNDVQKKLYEDIKKKFRSESDANINIPSDAQLFKDEDEVRIIVELESEPSIVYATKNKLSYENFSSAKSIEAKIEAEQEAVKKEIQINKVDMKFIHSFKTAFNGFSGKVKFGDIKLIEKIPSVKKVYIANEYERPDPEMISSNDMVGTRPTWETGYKGEGTVIAIIDSGIDPNHRDMKLSEGIDPKLTREIVQDLITSKGLLGRYYTEKIPYGYNYYDLNHQIKDVGPAPSEHGMHVAGIAGANGDVENGGIKGVAPEAQLLAMKVFSNDPVYSSTFSDIYLLAIDEAVRLGADVLNMSLGSPAGFYLPDSAEAVALKNATDNGIVCSVSAGNAGQFTWGWTDTHLGYPIKENPDIGVVGVPGLNKDTIQVASIENTNQLVNTLTYEVDGEVRTAPILVAGNIEPWKVLQGPQKFADGGAGHPSELTQVEGKVALIVRGGDPAPFVEKIKNAQEAGAIGVIVRNHEAGGEGLVNMQTPDDVKIPAVFVGYKAGLELLELEEKYVTFTDELISVPNPTGGLMSDFTSWGTTASFELKPEITAPGGKIYSTLNDDRYGIASGTSMAAPHVAGGSALVMEYIKEHTLYRNLPLSEQSRLTKVLLMNTANIVLDDYGCEYSPRRQGAGLMDIYGAVTTPVRVVDADTKEAKVELKDFESTAFTMRFLAINDSGTDATYNVNVVVLKDYIYSYGDAELNLLSSDYIDAIVDSPDTITVPANDQIEFEVRVDIGSDPTIYRNMFVEGFVVLSDVNGNNPNLSVPYVGFYGNWGEPKIIDGMRFIDPVDSSYFQLSGMLYADLFGTAYYYNTSNRIYMSPGTIDGLIFGTDNVLPYMSFLRNAEFVNYRILDGEGNNLRNLYTSQYQRKNLIDNGRRSPTTLVMDAWWFGDINGEIVPDGDYIYEIEAKIHYDNASVQSKQIPIIVDTVVPEIVDLVFDRENNKVRFKVVEESSGVMGFLVYLNDELLDEEPVLIDEEESLYEIGLDKLIGVNEVEVVVIDKAFNIGSGSITIAVDNEHPYIFLLKPLLLETFTDNNVLFEGYVANFHLLDKVLVDGQEAEIEYVENATITNPEDPTQLLYKGPAYKFKKVLVLEDGYHEIKVEAISKSGTNGGIARMFYVDTKAPELEVVVTNIDTEDLKAELNIRMFDELGNFVLYLGDSEIYRYEYPLLKVEPTEMITDYTVNLKEGENVFNFTLVDLGGHETKVQLAIDPTNLISNVQPSEDVILKAGDTLNISFNAPSGGKGYYKIMLPFGLENSLGTPMVEEKGLYSGTWIVPEGLAVSNLTVEVVYVDANGRIHSKMAEGKITVVRDLRDLPGDTTIVGDEAYHVDYLNSNPKAQRMLIEWINGGKEVYIKPVDGRMVNLQGKDVSIEVLPERIIYYDVKGNITYYEK